MSIFFNDRKGQHPTLTEKRSFLGVMIDPEIDSYFILQSKIRDSSKSEEVRKELKKVYEEGISDAVRNMVRKILLLGGTASLIDCEEIKKELKRHGIQGNHIERIIDLLWKESQNPNH